MKNKISLWVILAAVMASGLFPVTAATPVTNAYDIRITQRASDNSAWVDRIIPGIGNTTVTNNSTYLTAIGALGTSGATTITTVGNVTAGSWQANVIAGQFGGTGVANTGKTLTLGGNVTIANSLTFTGTNGSTLNIGAGGTLGPIATQNFSIIFGGDSLTAGNSVTPPSQIWATRIVQLYGYFGASNSVNTAVGGRTVQDVINGYPTEVYPYRPQLASSESIYLVWVGVNDVVAGTSAATIYTQLKSLWATARTDGFLVGAFTITQTAGNNPAILAEINRLIRSDRSLYDYLIEPDLLNLTYPPGDLHSNPASQYIIAANVNQLVALLRTNYTGSGFITQQTIGAVATAGLTLNNTTAATVGQQQWAPLIQFHGSGWKTNATAAAQDVDWLLTPEITQGTTAPTSTMKLRVQIGAGAGYLDAQQWDQLGNVTLPSNLTLANAGTITASTFTAGSSGASLEMQQGGSGKFLFNRGGNVTQTLAGNLEWKLQNPSTATNAYTSLTLNNASSASVLYMFGTGWTTSGRFVQDSTLLDSSGLGGLSISAVGSTPIRFYLGSEIARFSPTNGNLLIGTTSETGLTGGAGMKLASTTEATTGGAASLITAGGIYAAKKIITGTEFQSVGNATIGGVLAVTGNGTFSAGLAHLSERTAASTKSGNYTLVYGTDYLVAVDTSGGNVTITLPASPANGDTYVVKKTAAANTLTVARNGNNIDGSATDDTTYTTNQSKNYTFITGFGWAIN